MVDFIHIDPHGTVWAFVSLLDDWVAVNTKYVTHVEKGTPCD